jgi:hypothetical protein
MKHILNIIIVLSIISSIGLSQKSKQLFQLERKHKFSSTNNEDTFKITVKGENIFDSYITFTVVNWRGKEIYRHRFSMGDFCEFGPPESDKAYRRDSEDSTSIIEDLTQFFDEERFDEPAIKDTADMESNSIPREVWWEIWQDKTAIDFHYQLGAEDGRGIVYSKKRKKVIQYYACC